MSELNHLLEGVEGFLHDSEPEHLGKLAFGVPKGQCIVEVGSYRGRSTIALAYGAQDGVIVYAVDPHEEHEVLGLKFGMADNAAFMANVSRAGMGHKIRAINLPSHLAWEGFGRDDIALLFIDGAHDYDSIKADLRWLWNTTPNCKLAIHDSNGTWADPTRVADELAADSRWRELETIGYTRVFQKVSE